MKIIYVDSLFLLNTVIDYLLLLAAGRICALPLRRGRIGLGAVLGGTYAAASVFPGLGFLAGGVGKLLAGASMTLAAYGRAGRFFRTWVTLLAVSCAFGGAVWAACLVTGTGMAVLDLRVLLAAFALCYALVSLVFRCAALRSEARHLTAEITLAGRRVTLRALRDTGNCLRDPLSGDRVLVAEHPALAPLGLGQTEDWAALLRRMNADPDTRGRFRLIPYSAVGTGAGLLPAFRPDCLRLDGTETPHVLVAVSPQRLGDGTYSAIF